VPLLNKPSNLLGNKIPELFIELCGKSIENCSHQLSPPISLQRTQRKGEIFIFIPTGLKTSSTWSRIIAQQMSDTAERI
jgi:hypothetical protein